jgi:glucose/mannose-6-phosphate isomerase
LRNEIIFPVVTFIAMSKTMDALIAEFPDHLNQALKLGATLQNITQDDNIRNVLIVGLGGSGIGGRIASQIISADCPVPVSVCSDYTIPAFADENTLLIACSYSGNTEETLFSVNQAVKAGCRVACITSGGKLMEMAQSSKWPLFQVPAGCPPRAALGFSLVAQLLIFQQFGLTTLNVQDEVRSAVALLKRDNEEIVETARVLAGHLSEGVPVIYSEARFEGVATRFRQQVNENAKMLCWHHALPEMNHNELVGWGGGDDRFRVVAFRSDFDHPRTQTRMELCRGIIEKKAAYREIFANGPTVFQQSLWLIALGDWTSWFLSQIREVDAMEVNVIDFLKGELSRSGS